MNKTVTYYKRETHKMKRMFSLSLHEDNSWLKQIYLEHKKIIMESLNWGHQRSGLLKWGGQGTEETQSAQGNVHRLKWGVPWILHQGLSHPFKRWGYARLANNWLLWSRKKNWNVRDWACWKMVNFWFREKRNHFNTLRKQLREKHASRVMPML